MGIEKLSVGSILLTVKDLTLINQLSGLSLKQVKKKLPDATGHAFIYQETETTDGKIKREVIHAQTGRDQRGVRRDELFEFLKPSNHPLGKVYILRPKEKSLWPKIANRSSKWAPQLSSEETAKLPKDKEGKIKLPTYLATREKEIKTSKELEEKAHYIVYRAFRAYRRNETEYEYTYPDKTKLKLNATPLSKKKGVSCDDFAAYSYKVALIESVFPDGLPKNIKEAMDAIEDYKNKHGIKKLEHIPDELYKPFAEAILASDMKSEVVDQLSVPVKGVGIGIFSSTAFVQPETWEFSGYLCYVPVPSEDTTKPTEYEPYMIDHASFQKLCEKDGTHSIIVTQDELKILQQEETQTQKLKTP